MPQPPALDRLLHAAVTAVGGVERSGQVAMAEAVDAALESGEPLLVQAGTGTGKSLAYLVPALRHAIESDKPVIVATATLALQAQIVNRDLPALVDALTPHLPQRPTFAILKGRHHYVCRRKLAGDSTPDEEPVLVDYTPRSGLGREVSRAQAWAQTTQTGHRDDLLPGVSDRAWAQVSVPAADCIGATRCPFGATCFAERARAEADRADIVVTNHAMLALDVMQEIAVLPEHDAVVIDEAHELVDRVTSAATEELAPGLVDRAASRCRRALGGGEAGEVDALESAGAALSAALSELEPRRLSALPQELRTALRLLSAASRSVQSALHRARGEAGADDAPAKRLGWSAAEGLRGVADRCESMSQQDVLWISTDDRRGKALHVAPLGVGGLLRNGLFAERSVVLTSATLQIGGSFEPVARAAGLGGDAVWHGLDVGSPFDYPRQAMLYVAAHLPPPGRDSVSGAALGELSELVVAAGGRTLGLFSSMRAAQAAAEHIRTATPYPVLCQGEGPTGELIRQFAANPETCLLGTMSLWQGVDVPGPSLQLVVIDRLPFPRPDDPLATARAALVASSGGNGFLDVFAASAAVKLAQGAGRLVRSAGDRGVVAVLDSRLASARYADYLLRSLPPLWLTRNPAQVRQSLRSLAAAAAPGSATGASPASDPVSV